MTTKYSVVMNSAYSLKRHKELYGIQCNYRIYSNKRHGGAAIHAQVLKMMLSRQKACKYTKISIILKPFWVAFCHLLSYTFDQAHALAVNERTIGPPIGPAQCALPPPQLKHYLYSSSKKAFIH